MTYFNTTSLAGSELREATASSESLKEAVVHLFRKKGRLSPWQAHGHGLNGTITGIRCAITVLTDQGLLRKTGEKVMGPYGRPEFVWELA